MTRKQIYFATLVIVALLVFSGMSGLLSWGTVIGMLIGSLAVKHFVIDRAAQKGR